MPLATFQMLEKKIERHIRLFEQKKGIRLDDEVRFIRSWLEKPLSMGEMLYGIKAVTSTGAQFTWVPADFLREQKVAAWRDMPVWVPPQGRPGFSQRSVATAVAKGLTFRPLAVTAKDTLDWHKTRPAEEQAATLRGEINGIGMKREAEVLAAWKNRT